MANNIDERSNKEKPELEKSAAEILRRDKNIKEVEITEKVETEKGFQPAVGRDRKKNSDLMRKISAGGSGGNGKKSNQKESNQAGQDQDKKQPEGKEPSEKKSDGQKADGEGLGPSASSPQPDLGELSRTELGTKAGQAGKPESEKPKEQKEQEEGDGKEGGEKTGEEKPNEEEKEKPKEPKEGEEADKKDDDEKTGKEGEESEQEPDEKSGKDGENEEEKKDQEEKPEEKEDSKKENEGQDGEKGEDSSANSAPSADSGQDGSKQANSGHDGEGEKSKEDWQPGGRTKKSESDNLDNELLENSGEEDEAAQELKKRKKGEAGAEGDNETGAADTSSGSGQGGEPKTLREKVIAARQALNLKEQAKKKIEEKVMAPARAGTSWLLKASWANLIDSFGLTLIYINMHVFLRWVFPDLFCKLGEEWAPKIVAGESSAKNVAGTAFGIIEIMGLLMIDLILFSFIMAALALIFMIVDFKQASLLEKIKMFIGGLSNLDWSEIKDLYRLFAPSWL